MLQRIRQSLARMIAPRSPKAGVRMYGAAKSSRLTGGFAGIQNSSADAELSLSLTQLRARSRQLVRDAGYAKRAKILVVNNVVGAGVGLQATVASTRGNKRAPLNDAIESSFRTWSRGALCHIGGVLHFHDIERMAMGQVFEAGEVIIRLHNRAMPGSRIPLALEIIEAERLADEYTTPGGAVPSNVRMGVEQDEYFRPIAYWIREGHPGDLRGVPLNSQRFVRVPADQILHLKLTDRWPQTRGEPWMHAAIRKLHDMDEYSGAELTAARASANYFGTIESTDENPLGATEQEDGQQHYDMEAGIIQKLSPGEKFNFHTPNRPNSALDAFMRYMLREVAAAVGVSYESLSRDYSQSNYSSSRLALLDDRDLWRVLQQWWVRSFREPLHSVFMQRAVLTGAIPGLGAEQFFADPDRYQSVRWKLRGWTWVDPTKEVTAYKEAVKAGFTTVTKVIEQTGAGDDIEDVLEQREHELEMMQEHGLQFDTDPAMVGAPAVGVSAQPEEPDDSPEDDEDDDAEDSSPQQRVIAIRR
jgi:lambda family phage portal protein